MKYDRGELDIVPTHHGVEHGIIEMAQRGIRRNAAHHDVETLAVQSSGKAARPGFDEVAAIGNATDDWVTPLFWVDRELRRGDHIPHHIAPTHVRVTAIAAVIRQSQLTAGEIAYGGDRLELGAQGGRRPSLPDHTGDGFALGH